MSQENDRKDKFNTGINQIPHSSHNLLDDLFFLLNFRYGSKSFTLQMQKILLLIDTAVRVNAVDALS